MPLFKFPVWATGSSTISINKSYQRIARLPGAQTHRRLSPRRFSCSSRVVRFSVLVVGEVSHASFPYISLSVEHPPSGVGESSLINAVFRAKNLTVRARFVGGDIENLRTTQEFIKRRNAGGSSKTGSMLFGCAARSPFSGGQVFEQGDGILLQDLANKGILIGSLETGVSMLTAGNLAMRKKSVRAWSVGTNIVEWERWTKETAMEAIKASCGKSLNVVASNRHTWTENLISSDDRVPINLTVTSIMDIPTKAGPKTQTTTGGAPFESEQPNLGGWLSAVAQRGSLGTKISTSIHVGRQCSIGVGHSYDIVNVWNSNDPNHQAHLASVVATIVQTNRILQATVLILRVIGRAAAMVRALPPSAPFVLPAAIVVSLASWAYAIYQRTSMSIMCRWSFC
ncbi:hypothetical protein BS47DRAFT_1392618 [Hydnum rufescens UP504]|uniref:Uncharacterized protein n=1 Tax=Hydnum rufescens UP504 TaxID=1448309 RepID=A0A9P6DXS9_9AGAM|nr:hypothetical protein BS47DRAFT_1392618 [Hydnum rufescens UP504]